MVLFDYRMVEGQSLHYYYNHPLYYHPQSEMDELILPPSPINSAQVNKYNINGQEKLTNSNIKLE